MYLVNLDLDFYRQLTWGGLHVLHTVCWEWSIGQEHITNTLSKLPDGAFNAARAPIL